MNANNLEHVTRLVIQAVKERLGAADPSVIEVVTREVVAAMSDSSSIPKPSTPPSPTAIRGENEPRATPPPRGNVPPQETRGQALERCASCLEQSRRQNQTRAIITTTGRNAKGVVATVSAQIAAANGDIQDISQTIVADYFTMIMVVDISALSAPFSEFKERLLAAAEKMGIHAVVMHEDVMRALQRV